jgi:hypothetical protein
LNSLLNAFVADEKLLARDELLETADRLQAASGEPGAWEQIPSESWMFFQRRGQEIPTQGWKLHVSATPQSAAEVLAGVLPVLLRGGSSFKMVRSKRLLTIYPSTEGEAVRLAEECHQATSGLKGPQILSDRRYRPDSLVYYRYGGFTPQIAYNSEGRIVHVIRDPQGRLVPDSREAWFSAPSWVEDPFRLPEATPAAPRPAATAVLLGGRYEVAKALRHANKGGVYLGTDRESGVVVVIKEARPSVGTDRFGRDAVDGLRAEAANLERLAGLGVAPGSHGLLEEGGHLFLVVDEVPGTSLRQMRKQQWGGFPAGELLALARATAALLKVFHDAGMVVRDFNPNNLMVLPDGSPLAIDLEMACMEGDERPMAVGGFTPGYGSPQQRRGETPRRSDDEISLAATLFFIATGRDPFLIEDTAPARSVRDRLAVQLRGMVDDGFVPAVLEAPIVAGLSPEPDERWSVDRVLEHLDRGLPERSGAPRTPGRTPAESARDLLEFAVSSVDAGNKRRPLATSCAGQTFDPCCVQYGAAGVGMFLLRALPPGHAAGHEAVAGLARWVAKSLGTPAGRPAGLYFGAAGAAWFLLEAAAALGDPELDRRARELALSLRPHPGLWDITHGASGVGMTLLHFHHATGDPAFLDAAVRLADEMVAAGRQEPYGTVWPQADAAGKETTFYGFAHGSAGIAYFLLAAYAASGEARFLAASETAADTVIGAVQVKDGCAYWPHGPERPTLWTFWCNGSSGVGTTLARLHQVTGREHYRELARMAAEAVYRDRWNSGPGQCHGLAGNAEFLLDLHQILGEDEYLESALELGRILLMHGIQHDGLTVFADDSGVNVVPDYAVGNSGIGVFFNRLATGAGRIFMVDEVIAGRSAEPVPA